MLDSLVTLDPYIKRCRNSDSKEILESCKRGHYFNEQNEAVDMSDQVRNCIENTKSFRPDYDYELPPLKKKEKGTIEIRNETTIRGALRMCVEEEKSKVCALNFASSCHPGGGFLNFSTAQEESLCRSSALYYSLIQKDDLYEYNRQLDTNLASDYLIFTPDCPVWKLGEKTLDSPFLVSFITSPAVHNFNVQTREEIRDVHHERIKKILYCAICNGVKNIILGAYGCGAFHNNPEDVANSFKYWLVDQNLKDYFESISFSIIERKDRRINQSLKNIDVFANVFNLSVIETEEFVQNKKKVSKEKERKNKNKKTVKKPKKSKKSEKSYDESDYSNENEFDYDFYCYIWYLNYYYYCYWYDYFSS